MKYFKKTLLLISIILIFSLLSSCGSEAVNTTEVPSSAESFGKLVLIEEYHFDGLDQYVLYDPEELVMYTLVADSNRAGITIMEKSDGTPKLYAPE